MNRTVTDGNVTGEVVEGDDGRHTLTLSVSTQMGQIQVQGTRDELTSMLATALQALGAQRVLVTWQPEFALVHSEAPQQILQWGDKPAEWSITVGDDLSSRRRLICTDCYTSVEVCRCPGGTGTAVQCTECCAINPYPHNKMCSEYGRDVRRVDL